MMGIDDVLVLVPLWASDMCRVLFTNASNRQWQAAIQFFSFAKIHHPVYWNLYQVLFCFTVLGTEVGHYLAETIIASMYLNSLPHVIFVLIDSFD